MSKKVEKFEELIASQKARKLAGRIYKATNQGNFARDYSLKDQIRRAVVSTMSNIAEGFERGGAAEFHRFLVIAKGSCAELRNQLSVALDVAYIPSDEFDSLMADAVEVGKIIGGTESFRSAAKSVLRIEKLNQYSALSTQYFLELCKS